MAAHNRFSAYLIATLVLGMFPSPSNATLIGDTIEGTVTDVGFNWSSNTATVGSGANSGDSILN